MNIHDILKNNWGHQSFRPLQQEIIQSVLDGKDVLALLPTGGGKSICFQVPALAKDGLCLVISPLIALMKDQVQNLRRKNITAFAIYAGMSRREVINIFKLAAESNCKFLYVSPERLETNLFKEYLPSFNINLVAIDEAHCISQWGYDFRPPYLRIASLREELPGVPFLALTASATREIQKDIADKLQLKQHVVFSQSFARKNLSFSVFSCESKINKIREVLQKVAGTAIIYCKSRKRTKWISDLLTMHGVASDFYHAGLKQEERSRKQDEWMKGNTRVIVCTNAFGMGIDKPDVRVVIHADAPDCLENYYQEAGRAGRDEKNAYAVLLYSEPEIAELNELPDIHFPSIENIRIVYQAVVNYLQIPQGTENVYYDFDMTDFIKKFKLDTNLAVYALKALEQEELFSLNEQVFIQSSVFFTTNKEGLYDFEKVNPLLEPLIKTLLRTYSGIFDQPVHINEKVIAGLLHVDLDELVNQLKILHGRGVIEYIPQKDGPQLYISHARVKAEDLRINEVNYKKRKEQYKKRVGAALQYISTTDCRSQYIAKYFGEDDAKSCGVCDNCLKKKKTPLSNEEFNNIHQRVLKLIETSEIPASKLFQHLEGIQKDKLNQVINFLQAEKKLVVDEDGFVRVAG
ncbi:MAG: RecQ family ATP-dependent DNA helicase [Bacteroidetes bacterium]|nr:RecQ family ATP-dependent DNA helicase [Bacteroidota bacterium]